MLTQINSATHFVWRLCAANETIWSLSRLAVALASGRDLLKRPVTFVTTNNEFPWTGFEMHTRMKHKSKSNCIAASLFPSLALLSYLRSLKPCPHLTAWVLSGNLAPLGEPAGSARCCTEIYKVVESWSHMESYLIDDSVMMQDAVCKSHSCVRSVWTCEKQCLSDI